MQVSTQVIGSPPCTPPTIDFANSTSRREMPPVSIRLPARMKNGTAASGNLSIAVNISFGTVTSLSGSVIAIPTMLAAPIDTATDRLSTKHSSIVTIIASVIAPPSPCRTLRRRLQLAVLRIEQVRDHREHAQQRTDGNREIRPRHRDLEAGEGLEADPPREVEAEPGEHGEKGERDRRDRRAQPALPSAAARNA